MTSQFHKEIISYTEIVDIPLSSFMPHFGQRKLLRADEQENETNAREQQNVHDTEKEYHSSGIWHLKLIFLFYL